MGQLSMANQPEEGAGPAPSGCSSSSSGLSVQSTGLVRDGQRYLVRDRDTSYGAAVTRRLQAMGICDRPITPRSPWQNGHVERLIGSIRRECLDHVVVL